MEPPFFIQGRRTSVADLTWQRQRRHDNVSVAAAALTQTQHQRIRSFLIWNANKSLSATASTFRTSIAWLRDAHEILDDFNWNLDHYVKSRFIMRNWTYSFLLLIAYLSLFGFWNYAPSRTVFVGLGFATALGLSVAHWRAHARGYFVNRVDSCLHAYVILDVLLESISFEGLSLLIERVSVQRFHDNFNFIGCAAVLCSLIGGHRFLALRASGDTVQDGSRHE